MGLDAATAALFGLGLAVVTLATRRRPALGVTALLVATPFDFTYDVGHTTITLAKVALAGVVLGLALRRVDVAALGTPEVRLVVAGASAILAATALSILVATYRGPALRETLKAAQYLATLLVAAIAFRADPDLRLVARGLAATTLAVALLALEQLAGGAASQVLLDGRVVPRIAGPLEGPNQLAGYLGLTLPVLLALGCQGVGGRLGRAALAAGGVALVLTLSRTGVATTLLALVVAIALTRAVALPPARRHAILWLAGGIALGLALLGGGVARYGTLAEVAHAGGVGNRSILWHAAVELWRTHPLLGIGAGNFEFEIGRVGPPGVRTHANSLYLQALVEGGLPLFIATIGSLAATLLVLARASRRSPFVAGTFAATLGLALHQIVDLLVFFPKVGLTAWTLVGSSVALAASMREVSAKNTFTWQTRTRAGTPGRTP